MKKIFFILFCFIFLSSCTKNDSNWSIQHYVDQWGHETEESCATIRATGYMGNSVTEGSKAILDLNVDKKNISFSLYDYGTLIVKKPGSYYFSLKDKNGKVYTLWDNEMKKNDVETGQIYLQGKTDKIFRKVLLDGGTINITLKISGDYSETRYIFQIDNADGLKEILEKTYRMDS